MLRKYLLPVIGAAMFVFAVYHVVRAQQVAPKTDPLIAPAKSPFEKTVAGTGMVEPETENISIGSPLPGLVVKLDVRVGDKVQCGQPMFRLDDRNWQAELAARKANLQSAQAQLDRLRAQPRAEDVPPAEARVNQAEANLVDLKDQYDRMNATAKGSPTAVTDAEVIHRKQAYEAGKYDLAKAKADLATITAGAWKSDIAVAEAAVAQAEAAIKQTETELDRLIIRASVTGEVLQVNVRLGEYVGTPPNQALIVLGGAGKHVRVDIDENDLCRFREGLPARALRRGDTMHEIPLRFVRVEPYVIPKKSLTGGSTERVDTRVLQVIYAVEKSPVPMYVGQQIDVFLDVSAGEPRP
ncbi:MAG TPA: biotin/lipoyl-binding protein [Gemmataceae bacterium]|jgi:multidrug efflux pump subunit AcrA (membrane-fusion protein)|nr:biotin/lipoyl-binding protein [Gemmataceae bacterium]